MLSLWASLGKLGLKKKKALFTLSLTLIDVGVSFDAEFQNIVQERDVRK